MLSLSHSPMRCLRFALAGLCFSMLAVHAVSGQDARVRLELGPQQEDQRVEAQLVVEGSISFGLVDATLNYNPEVFTLTEIEPLGTTANTLFEHIPAALPDNDGELRIAGVFAGGIMGTTTVANLVLLVDPEAARAPTTFNFSSVRVTDTDEKDVMVLAEDATFIVATDVATAEDVPDGFVLHPNYPNPFNPSTTIVYELPQTATVRIEVYDVIGRRVAVLVEGTEVAGRHQVRWDATRMASGLYFTRMIVDHADAQRATRTQKMLLVK